MVEKSVDKKDIRLQVREAQQDEAFKGIVRIDSEMLKEIGIRPAT